MTLKTVLKEFKKDVLYFLDIDTPTLDSMPTHTNTTTHTIIQPVIQHANRNKPLLTCKRR